MKSKRRITRVCQIAFVWCFFSSTTFYHLTKTILVSRTNANNLEIAANVLKNNSGVEESYEPLIFNGACQICKLQNYVLLQLRTKKKLNLFISLIQQRVG